ncbi:MAG: hypothetical protein JNM72_11900 [Deltaproteobacteria bacterium]|nr:hypothetical protein [Deltaproteobacteria bacterium]
MRALAPLSTLLLAGNAALLLWIGALAATGALSGNTTPLPPTPPTAAPTAAAPADPRGHLPLGGMPGGPTAPHDACLRLEGFLLNLNAQLVAAGKVGPRTLPELRQLSATGRCAVSEPAVAEVLSAYGVALRAAGLPLVGPVTGGSGGAHKTLRVERRAPTP